MTRRRFVAGVLALAATIITGIAVMPAQPVHGAGVDMNNEQGYYDQGNVYRVPGRTRDGTYVFEEGISPNWQQTGVNKSIFINAMKKRLDGAENGTVESPETQQARAAAVIAMMLGQPGATFNGDWRNGVAYARANYARWVGLIDQYDTAWKNNARLPDGTRWGVNFDDIFSDPSPEDRLGLLDQNFDGKYGPNPLYRRLPDLIKVNLGMQVINEEAVTFYNQDGTTFRLLKKCLNIAGDVGPLTAPTPTPTPPTPAPTPPPAAPAVKPYFKVLGGDVVAGSSFATDAKPCSAAGHLDSAGIVSWNSHGTPDFRGAGGQYGVLARGQIQDFVSGQGNGRVLAGQEKDELSFSNKNYSGSINYNKGLFGGMFGDGISKCVSYWDDRPTNTTAQPAGPVGTWSDDKPYYLSGNITLGTSVIPKGKQLTVYVEGNVAIAGAITYEPGTFTSRQDIPSFRLIVNGVVYIDKDVTALDGSYVAIPDDGQTGSLNNFATPKAGTVSSCASGFSSYDPSKLLTTSSTYLTACAKPLLVTGSMVAQQVWLLRTANLGGTPAETFQYAPDIWLAPSGANGSNAASDYQSVIGLPPTL